MKQYGRVLRTASTTPWAILPEKLIEVREFLARKARGEDVPEEEVRRGRAAPASGQPEHPRLAESGPGFSGRMSGRGGSPRAPGGSVAVLPLTGVLAQRMDLMLDFSGGTSTDRFRIDFLRLIEDDQVGAVVLDVDSPGGSVFGTDELSAEIFRARGRKPIVAAVNSLAASAAYWIASAADEVAVTPGGLAGSIGVFALHEDISAWLDQQGIKVSLVSAGEFKTEGNEFEPLGEEARAALQAEVDRYYAMFTAAVGRNRGVAASAVRSGFGQGRLVGAREAVKLGMADRVATLPETIARLGGRRPASSPQKALDKRGRELVVLEG